jgi:hypothetical protein
LFCLKKFLRNHAPRHAFAFIGRIFAFVNPPKSIHALFGRSAQFKCFGDRTKIPENQKQPSGRVIALGSKERQRGSGTGCSAKGEEFSRRAV